MTTTPRPTAHHGRYRQCAGETGSMAVELAVLTVPLVAILLLIAALGRFSDARNQVTEAARDAAREASTYISAAQAASQADQVARSELSGVCQHASISTNTAQLHPGGQVTVTVTCPVPLGDLTLIRVPGTRTITASSMAVVDTYIQGQGGS
jgi:Flp pilus assembly protein TadG